MQSPHESTGFRSRTRTVIPQLTFLICYLQLRKQKYSKISSWKSWQLKILTSNPAMSGLKKIFPQCTAEVHLPTEELRKASASSSGRTPVASSSSSGGCPICIPEYWLSAPSNTCTVWEGLVRALKVHHQGTGSPTWKGKGKNHTDHISRTHTKVISWNVQRGVRVHDQLPWSHIATTLQKALWL